MQPMKPMQPMEPLKPPAGAEPWWPHDLGDPSSSGGQDGVRYAFFAEARRLVVEDGGDTATYDTGARRITGVSQAAGVQRKLTFSSDDGPVDLAALDRAD
jgi:hypothetical protein